MANKYVDVSEKRVDFLQLFKEINTKYFEGRVTVVRVYCPASMAYSRTIRVENGEELLYGVKWSIDQEKKHVYINPSQIKETDTHWDMVLQILKRMDAWQLYPYKNLKI